MQFEWEQKKAAINLAKHSVSFEEAATVFEDPLAITIDDPDHSIYEFRYLTTGQSARQRLIIVAHAEREDRIRIIMAREMTNRERKQYESAE